MSDIRAKLPFMTKAAFGVGSTGEVVFLGMFNGFIAIFYNQAIGLSNSLIGTAIMLAMIGDAISDPLVGMISDRWKSKLGRRHPFLFIAPIPLALSLFMVFSPPDMLTGGATGEVNQTGLFIWLVCWTVLGRLFLTLFTIPHYALGGELTQEPHDRAKLFSMDTLFGALSGTLFAVIVWGVFLAGETTLADGNVIPRHLDKTAYPPVVLTSCAIIIGALFLSALGTKHRIPLLSTPPVDQTRVSLSSFYRELVGALKNPNYAFLMIGFFLLMISIGLDQTMSVFTATYFWELAPEQIKWFGLVVLPGVIIGATASPILMKKFDRKPVLIGGLLGVVVFAQLPIDLRLLGLMPANGSELLMPLLLGNVFLGTISAAAGAVAMMSMLGDLTDENEALNGLRQEGLIYSARAFFAKASNSVGHFVGGIILDLFVVMPFEAVPGQVDSDVIWRLGIMAGPVMGIASIIALPFYMRYRMTRQRHEEILDELEARRPSTDAVADPEPKPDSDPDPAGLVKT